jgi:hypothetical protein
MSKRKTTPATGPTTRPVKIALDDDIASILFTKLREWADELGLAAERNDPVASLDLAGRAHGLARKLKEFNTPTP